MPDPTVTIRRYQPQDRSAAMSLATRLEIGVAPWRDARAVREAVTGWVRRSLDGADGENRMVLVAIGAQGLAGFVTVATRRHFTGDVDAYIGELVVAEDAERRGIGTLLMQAAEEWARSRGFRHITLETGAANTAAKAFYGSQGYLEEDVRLTKALSGVEHHRAGEGTG